jgi:hypothetical protein
MAPACRRSATPQRGAKRRQSITLSEDDLQGDVWFVVAADTEGAIFETDEADNAAVSAGPASVPLVLGINLAAESLWETGSAPLEATVVRNGPTADPLVVFLSTIDPQGQPYDICKAPLWVIDHAQAYRIVAVNLSFAAGSVAKGDGMAALETLYQQLEDQGIFIAAAAVLVREAADRAAVAITPAGIRDILRLSGTLIFDGDDEDDNVPNSGRTYRRLDLWAALDCLPAADLTGTSLTAPAGPAATEPVAAPPQHVLPALPLAAAPPACLPAPGFTCWLTAYGPSWRPAAIGVARLAPSLYGAGTGSSAVPAAAFMGPLPLTVSERILASASEAPFASIVAAKEDRLLTCLFFRPPAVGSGRCSSQRPWPMARWGASPPQD